MAIAAHAFPSQCVVDASVLIKVVLQEPGSDIAHVLLASTPLDSRAVPDLAYLECASILTTTARRGVITTDQARGGLIALYRVPVTVHPSTPLISTALSLALTYGISVYDATYLALADALGVPLVTADAALVRAVGGPPTRLRLLTDYSSS